MAACLPGIVVVTEVDAAASDAAVTNCSWPGTILCSRCSDRSCSYIVLENVVSYRAAMKRTAAVCIPLVGHFITFSYNQLDLISD